MSVSSLLIPHDGSPLSGAVVDSLGPLLGQATRVTLLHVDEGQGRDTDRVAETEQKLTGLGAVVTRSDVTSKDPAGAIVDAAAEHKPDLVAMSTHGHSGAHRRVRGGVAERVLRACSAPVFMVNPVTHTKGRFDSVLVPLELSQESAQILDTLIPIAKAFGARLTLLFVDFDDPTDTPQGRARRRAIRAQDAQQWLAEPKTRAEAAGLGVEICVAHGDPAAQILQLAVPGDHDLVAMTTHARAGVRRWLLGSVAEKVLRECRIPVLLRRPRPRTRGES